MDHFQSLYMQLHHFLPIRVESIQGVLPAQVNISTMLYYLLVTLAMEIGLLKILGDLAGVILDLLP